MPTSQATEQELIIIFRCRFSSTLSVRLTRLHQPRNRRFTRDRNADVKSCEVTVVKSYEDHSWQILWRSKLKDFVTITAVKSCDDQRCEILWWSQLSNLVNITAVKSCDDQSCEVLWAWQLSFSVNPTEQWKTGNMKSWTEVIRQIPCA